MRWRQARVLLACEELPVQVLEQVTPPMLRNRVRWKMHHGMGWLLIFLYDGVLKSLPRLHIA